MNHDECRKTIKATRTELRSMFTMEDGLNWANDQGEPEIEYVEWLEARLHASRTESKPVTREEIDELAGQMEDCISFDESGYFCGFNHKQALNILFKVLHLPAPQSPVVPGVDLSKLERWATGTYEQGTGPFTVVYEERKHPGGEWVRFSDLEKLVATGGRESWEDLYRQALESIANMVVWSPAKAIAEEALATTQPNEGVV